MSTRAPDSSGPAAARADLAAWQAARRVNFFESDSDLQRSLRFYWGSDRFEEALPRLRAAGDAATFTVDLAVTINDRPHNHPRLERWSATGERIESVEFHPSYHDAGRPIFESGILALQSQPGRALEQAALLYLFGQCGEAGHLCPVVCTAGLIRALQQKGSAFLQETYLPPLLNQTYGEHHTAAQSLTEIQGGSDVGANAVRATPEPGQPGTWRINGEKWFFSNATADQILITARPDGAPSGTRGLGLFLVPRRLSSGDLNGLYLRRLKDKFGTRAMASAEVDFRDALAFQVGEIDEGIHIVLEQVLNTSRWLNSIGSLSAFRRAYLEARHYAQRRRAFGEPIATYPLVQEALAEMRVDLAAGLAVTWRISNLVDQQDLGEADDEQRALFRVLVTLNKYRSSLLTSLGIRRAQEVLGGNGAIEDFSPIPRLYRDAVVYESWEGSHNVLCVQLLRDFQRYRLHEPLYARLRADLDRVVSPELTSIAEQSMEALEWNEGRLQQLMAADSRIAQTHIRRVLDHLASVVEMGSLLTEADAADPQELPPLSAELLHFYFNRYLRPGYDPLSDDAYSARIERVARA